jgi:hypothetical protein
MDENFLGHHSFISFLDLSFTTTTTVYLLVHQLANARFPSSVTP